MYPVNIKINFKENLSEIAISNLDISFWFLLQKSSKKFKCILPVEHNYIYCVDTNFKMHVLLIKTVIGICNNYFLQ